MKINTDDYGQRFIHLSDGLIAYYHGCGYWSVVKGIELMFAWVTKHEVRKLNQ